MTDLPEPDRLPDAPHPKETAQLFGQDEAIQTILDALNSDKVHHAWMLTGPHGIGKATLAYQAAAALLGKTQGGGLFGDPDPLTQLGLPADHPITSRIL
ncbi:MAG: DNA polymerase III subunit delta', partial [Pseudomonadota bacterium]